MTHKSVKLLLALVNIGLAILVLGQGAVAGLTLGPKSKLASPWIKVGAGTRVSLDIALIGPPVLIATFANGSIPLNGTSTLTFGISNSNATSLTGISFTDNLPGGLQISTNPALTSTCSGAVVAIAGSSQVSLSGATLTAAGTCALSVSVIGTVAGIQTNTVAAINSNEGGSGSQTSASIVVIAPPVITTTFGAASIPLNGVIPFVVTVTNSNASALTGVGFTNQFPSGLAVAYPTGLTNNCAGTVSAAAGSNGISLSGATLSAGGQCSLILDVAANIPGLQNDSTSPVSSNEGGPGNIATASIFVSAPLSITSLFGVGFLGLNSSTSLTFQISNPNTLTQTALSFNDQLPVGLSVASPSGLINSCGGSVGLTANSISLTSGTVTGNSQCSISLNVAAKTLGVKNDFTSAISSKEGGVGDSSSATLTVFGSPALSMSFGVSAMPLSGITALNFLITNPNAFSLSGLTFTNTFPAGLQVAGQAGSANLCNGVLQAVSNSNTIGLTGGTLPPGATCGITMNVQASSTGTKHNVTSAISSIEAGSGNTAWANLTVIGPPRVTTGFSPYSIPLNGVTNLNFQLTNPNGAPLTGVGLVDALPTGLLVIASKGFTNTCGGVMTTSPDATTISLSGATLSAAGSCAITFSLQAANSGPLTNATMPVISIEGGTGNSATSTLNVIAPPGMSAAFSPGSFIPGATSTFSVTLSDIGSNTLTGVGFTAVLPPGMLITAPNELSAACGGTAVATAGTGLVTLTGATVHSHSSCKVAVRVTAANEGMYSVVTSPVSSNEGGTGNTASASITVASPPAVTMKFPMVAAPPNGSVPLLYTVTNPNQSEVLTGISFTNVLPTGFQISTPNGLVGICGGGSITASPGSTTISLAGATLPANGGSCTFTVSLTGTSTGQFVNTTGPISSDETIAGPTASATITIGSVFEVSYAAHLNAGDGVINITNTGENGAKLYGPGFGPPTGNLCVNVYALAPGEQLISCCSCLVTPGALVSLSVNNDILANVAEISSNSVVVELVSTLAGSGGNATTCTNSAAIPGTLASGLSAWSTTLNTVPPPQTFTVNDLAFSPVTLSAAEEASLNNRCAQIIGNFGGLGVCRSCRVGGLGGIASPQ